jgi:hypothetical protein
MTFTKTGSTWKSKCGKATIYAYHNVNSTSYFLYLEGVCDDEQFFKLNAAKRFAKDNC